MELKLLTVKEVATLLRKTPAFVRREIHAGRLKAKRIGVELRVLEADVQAYLAGNASDGPAACRQPRGRRAGSR